MAKKTTTKAIRAGKVVSPRTRSSGSTAPANKPTRKGVPKLPYPREMFATIRGHESTLFPDICLWGVKSDAVENCDPDERVCIVRVEVLKVLD